MSDGVKFGFAKRRLIKTIRERLSLTEDMVTDEDILKSTKGTVLRAGIELNLACRDFSIVLRREIKKVSENIKHLCVHND